MVACVAAQRERRSPHFDAKDSEPGPPTPKACDTACTSAKSRQRSAPRQLPCAAHFCYFVDLCLLEEAAAILQDTQLPLSYISCQSSLPVVTIINTAASKEYCRPPGANLEAPD